jgi:prepilin-type N-terminal cleavage/methylation domain-containing protein
MNHTMNKGKTIMQAGKKVVDTSHGFTLVEIMTVLVIITILALFAAPEVIQWRPKLRLKSAADTLSENLQRAKIHAIKNNVSVIFTFTVGAGAPCTGGSYRFDDNAVPANMIASELFNDTTTPESTARTAGLCLEAPTAPAVIFVSGVDGFTSRGLPISASAKAVRISSANLNASGDPIYQVTQSIAGGLSLTKGTRP